MDACKNVISPESLPLSIKSNDMQDFIQENGKVIAASYNRLMIGFSSDAHGDSKWVCQLTFADHYFLNLSSTQSNKHPILFS